MYRSKLVLFPSMLVAAAALFGGCDDGDPGAPREAEAPTVELIAIGENGEACFSVDGADDLECYESEADADEALLAAIPRDDSGPAPAGSVPDCVHTSLDDSGWWDDLRVTNRCDSSKRVKVIIAFGPDFPCTQFDPGQSWDFWWGYPKRFDGLASC